MKGKTGFSRAVALVLGTSSLSFAIPAFAGTDRAQEAETVPAKAAPTPDTTALPGKSPQDPGRHVSQVPTSDSSAQSELTQVRQTKPTRFKPSTRPIPTFSDPYPVAAQGLGVRGGDYYVARWAEDWSFLRDKDKREARHDLFDPLKYIPINEDIWLSLSGEERLRANITGSPGLKDARQQDQELFRNIVGADLHLGQHVRLFAEVNGSQVTGANTGTISTQQRNAAVLEQAFAEINGDVLNTHLLVRAGTQEFMDGPPNIIHIRPAPNIYTTVNGVRLQLDWKFARIDLFDFRTLTLNGGYFDDPINPNETFKGFNASIRAPISKRINLFLDPFYFRYHIQSKKYGTTVGTEDRDFWGARLWGTIADGTMDVTVVRQTGTFANRPIDAWGLFGNFGYLLSNSKLNPRLGLHVDYTSGGGAYSTNGPIKDFNFFYGSIPYFSWGNLYGPTNVAVVAPSIRLTPFKKVTFTTEYQWLRRPNQFDAFYTFTGVPYAGTQNVRGHDFGTMLRADVAVFIGNHIQLALKAEHMWAGDVLKKAGYAGTTFLGPEFYLRW